MVRPVRLVAFLGLLGSILLAGTASAASAPKVIAIVEGRDTAGGRPVLSIVGTGLTAAKEVDLIRSDLIVVQGTTVLQKSKTLILLALPVDLPRGSYIVSLTYGKTPVILDSAVTLGGGDDSALFQGTFGSGTIPAEGEGTRMMWYPAKAAFRAGSSGGDHWDAANVGDYSFAVGSNTTASAPYAAAFGVNCHATGNFSTAMNYDTLSTGGGSVAMGSESVASGSYSVAVGVSTVAQTYGSLALGRCNVIAGSDSSIVATDPVLVVGNGASVDARSNAFTLLKNGNLTIAGALTQNSDARLKADIVPLSGVLAKLAAVRGVSYRFKDGNSGPAGSHIGLLAQEVRTAFPELVQEDPEGKLSVAYGNFAAVLLEAVKEQQATIDGQKAAIESQKTELASMARRLARLEALLEKEAPGTDGR